MLRQGHSDSQDWDWPDRDEDDERPRRKGRGKSRRKSPLRRAYTLAKLAIFLTPAAFFLFGSFFVDCRARPSFADWSSMLGASACARHEMIGNVTATQENFAVLRRLLD